MPNRKPNTTGLVPFDSERARWAQSLRKQGPPTVGYHFKIEKRQLDWLRGHESNVAAAIRRAIDLYIEAESG